MKIVKIQDVIRKFGNVAAVDHVSLDIGQGEIFGLLGPNGAGKSTMINIICGLLKMDSGKVEILGRDICEDPLFTKQNIGIVPQDIAIYEYLTAYENIRFFAGLYGLRGKLLHERVNEALEFVGLTEKSGSYSQDFSGGMKRRLNIACAIAHRPKLIIMDEPTVGIDPQSRNHILQSVRRLNDMGCTIIYTSHYMEEVEEICSRIAIMDHGKVIAEGNKEELKGIVTNVNSIWISVNAIGRVEAAALREINGVSGVEIEENTVKINSSTDINNLDKVIQYFTTHNIPIRNIENRAPDLETVFLTLTGRTLRN